MRRRTADAAELVRAHLEARVISESSNKFDVEAAVTVNDAAEDEEEEDDEDDRLACFD